MLVKFSLHCVFSVCCHLLTFYFSDRVVVTPHIFFLSKYARILFWDGATFICSASLAFVNVRLASLDAYDVTALARLFNALVMCASYTRGCHEPSMLLLQFIILF